MEAIGILIVALLVIFGGPYAWNRLRNAEDTDIPIPGNQPPGVQMADIPKNQKIYEIAGELADLFNIVAHPGELEASETFQAGVDYFCNPFVSREEVIRYAVGDHILISCMALRALSQRDDTQGDWREIMLGVETMAPYQHYFALQYLADSAPKGKRVVGPVLASTTQYLAYRVSRKALEGLVRHRRKLGETLAFRAEDIEYLSSEGMGALAKFLGTLGPKLGAPLVESLEELRPINPRPPEHQQSDVPSPFVHDDSLTSIGRVWTKSDARSAWTLARSPGIDADLRELRTLITADRPQSILLVGEAGVGKTTLQHMLARQLFEEKWTIFVAGHAELLAGQMFIGQFEQRLKGLIGRLQSSTNTVWHVPDFDQLMSTGTHTHSQFSAMDAILPHLANGSLRIMAGLEPSAYDRLVRIQPRIPSTMAVRHRKPATREQTLDIAMTWLGNTGQEAEAGLAADVWDHAQQYLGSGAAPGNVMDLLKVTLLRLAGTKRGMSHRVTLDDVIQTLVGQTGLPIEILDDKRDLDLDDLKASLSSRVIGQDEAISCLVDRVAMIKASLLDPVRPFGVFLFAGPTGTGKTEIAKSLATWLFGSTERLIRVDMSELQDHQSLDRLIGGENEVGKSDTLANQVRRQPFSVVLLDEFEKAHPNVWDLFLQIFDDGRITDRQGRTTSFRNTIIIMTANLGATIPTGQSIGFAAADQGFDESEVRSSIEMAFRREFINRIDRMVVFRPLDRDLMRLILHRELEMAFARRGLKGRPWAVEWDESAIGFLLEKGFTRDLGARPLRRAIETYLLAPLADTIVRHRFPEGDQFLFISRSGGRLRVEFVDPDLEETADDTETSRDSDIGSEPAAGSTDEIRSILLHPTGAKQEYSTLKNTLDEIATRLKSDEWENRKQRFFSEMEEPDFWERTERYSVLGLLETIDRVERGLGRAEGLKKRLDGMKARNALPVRLVSILAQNLYLLSVASIDILAHAPQDAFLLVEAKNINASVAGEHLKFAHQIANMYEAWADKRNMRLACLQRINPGSGTGMRAIFSVSGYGAHSILQPETGMHVLEVPDDGTKAQKRFSVQVTVAAQPAEPLSSDAAEAVRQAEQMLDEQKKSRAKIARRYRAEPSPLVRDNNRSWRTGRIDLVLGGDFDLL